jgi:hypothetical protein
MHMQRRLSPGCGLALVHQQQRREISCFSVQHALCVRAQSDRSRGNEGGGPWLRVHAGAFSGAPASPLPLGLGGVWRSRMALTKGSRRLPVDGLHHAGCGRVHMAYPSTGVRGRRVSVRGHALGGGNLLQGQASPQNRSEADFHGKPATTCHSPWRGAVCVSTSPPLSKPSGPL